MSLHSNIAFRNLQCIFCYFYCCHCKRNAIRNHKSASVLWCLLSWFYLKHFILVTEWRNWFGTLLLVLDFLMENHSKNEFRVDWQNHATNLRAINSLEQFWLHGFILGHKNFFNPDWTNPRHISFGPILFDTEPVTQKDSQKMVNFNFWNNM